MKHFLTHRTNYLTGLALMALLISLYFVPISAYTVEIDGESIGIVANQQEAENLVQEIVDEVNAAESYEMLLQSQIAFETTKASRRVMINQNQLKSTLNDTLKFVTTGYSLVVDGETLFILSSKEEADTFLEDVKNQYIMDGLDVQMVSFLEDVQVEKVETIPAKIEGFEQAWNRYEKGKQELEIYTVVSGDTTWDLVQEFKIDLEDLARVNPDVDLARLQIGQVINLNRPESYINVKTVVNNTVEETILSDITYEKTDTLYVGEKVIKSEGSNGKKMVNVESTYVNGIFEQEKVLSEEVIEEPVNTVLMTGTKWRKVVAVGEFSNPVNGVFTSRFGERWGRMHTGIDIGAPKGTPIKAAADGIVVHVGEINGYGMTVKVDHGNGIQTLYGHASGYNVELGQVVSKNDVIAYVGNTGRTTGYCLHFEVRVNGTPVDPMGYVNY